MDCTGVLTADTNGNIIHGRNMDKSVGSVKNMTLNITYTRNQQVIAVAVDYYWFNVGFVTGYKPGVVTISENWRKYYKDQDGYKLLQDIYNGSIPQVWMFREVFLNQDWQYDQILQYFLDKYACAPFYIIMGGPQPWQGAVISRDPVLQLPIYYMQTNATNGWYLVETNYDMWQPDSSTDPRRTVAENTLAKMG